MYKHTEAGYQTGDHKKDTSPLSLDELFYLIVSREGESKGPLHLLYEQLLAHTKELDEMTKTIDEIDWEKEGADTEFQKLQTEATHLREIIVKQMHDLREAVKKLNI